MESPSRVVTLPAESRCIIVDREFSSATSLAVLYHPVLVSMVSFSPIILVAYDVCGMRAGIVEKSVGEHPEAVPCVDEHHVVVELGIFRGRRILAVD
jgi:hypothetical protein